MQTGLSPESLAKLAAIEVSENSNREPAAKERVSLKDKPYIDILRDNPELEAQIVAAMGELAEVGMNVPVFHITSRAIRLENGIEQTTGYLENIAENGFRARDTNVAALMERGSDARIGTPLYFRDAPHKFLRAMATSLKHYAHHGSRTNKASLTEQRDQGEGIPVMLLIDTTKTPLIPGTDYDDHFQLGEAVNPSHIVGMVELTGLKAAKPTDIAEIAQGYASAITTTIEQRTAQATR